MRIGVASIVQESNTFAVSPTSFRDFEIYGIFCGDTITEALAGTNSEIWGAIEALQTLGVEPVPLVRAWAMSGGRAQHDVFVRLQHMLLESIAQAGRLDGVVLSLHGAWVAEGEDAADASIAEAVRAAVGPDTVVGVCLDLHANLTQRLIDATDVITAFHTYPHVDQADTGRRIARLVRATAEGSISPVCRIAKRPMLVPAEAQREDGPFGELRRLADDQTRAPVLDISLFPVQPWLDVPELGFGVTVAGVGSSALLFCETHFSSRRDRACSTHISAAGSADRVRRLPDGGRRGRQPRDDSRASTPCGHLACTADGGRCRRGSCLPRRR